MKNWMRYCASALATLTLLAGLASCKGGKTNPADSTENGNGTESDRSEVTTDNRDENGYLTLTEAGAELAGKIYERHRVLTRILTLLGVDEKVAAEDACKMEHDISAVSFAALKHHVEKMERGKA